jgi:hypothetical protein
MWIILYITFNHSKIVIKIIIKLSHYGTSFLLFVKSKKNKLIKFYQWIVKKHQILEEATCAKYAMNKIRRRKPGVECVVINVAKNAW